MINTKLHLSQKITNSAREIILKWIKENPNDSLLNIAQQVNYASVLLRTAGSNAEVEYKKKQKYGKSPS